MITSQPGYLRQGAHCLLARIGSRGSRGAREVIGRPSCVTLAKARGAAVYLPLCLLPVFVTGKQ